MVFTVKGSAPQVEISGTATLCFNEEGTHFEGSITAEDDTQFAIYGTKSQQQATEAQGQSTTDQSDPALPPDEDNTYAVTFDIRVVDCEVGEEYSLERVIGRNGEMCTFSCTAITFKTDDVYRGQKADMVSQNCLGHKMPGERTTVYRGPIKLCCTPVPRKVQWVL